MFSIRVPLLIALFLVTNACGKDKYMCKSRQAEAHATLKSIHSAEETFKAKNGRYSTSLGEIGYPATANRFYDVSVDAASDFSFTATATGKDQAAGDVWFIDQTGKLQARTDKCQ
jgi:hypothetical protein